MNRRARAFTLVELLIVIVILGLLLAMLLPSLRGAVQTTKRLRCAANLGHIGQAYAMQAADENLGRADALSASQWPAMLAPYLERASEVYRCEEDIYSTEEVAAHVPILKVEVWSHAPPPELGLPPDSFVWTMDCEEGQWAKKKNVTANSYELWFEDQWNQSWNDLILRFTDLGKWKWEVTYVNNGTATNWYHLVDTSLPPTPPATTGAILIERMGWPHDQDQLGRKVTVMGLGGGSGSYGMNSIATPDAVQRAGNRVILFLDYLRPAAKGPTTDLPDNWENPDWVAEDGTVLFARHFKMVNVLFTDNSVELVDPETINPANPSWVVPYWDPAAAR